MESPEVLAVISANHELANTLEVNGTPTFILEKMMVRGYVPLDAMRQIIADERKKG